jgi:hypothetical protein
MSGLEIEHDELLGSVLPASRPLAASFASTIRVDGLCNAERTMRRIWGSSSMTRTVSDVAGLEGLDSDVGTM